MSSTLSLLFFTQSRKTVKKDPHVLTHNRVRMHDTDMAGILYFPRQFRFAHDALEDFVESIGLTFDHVFRKEKFVFVIVHAEADYLAPLRVGDRLKIEVRIESSGRKFIYCRISHIQRRERYNSRNSKDSARHIRFCKSHENPYS